MDKRNAEVVGYKTARKAVEKVNKKSEDIRTNTQPSKKSYVLERNYSERTK